MSEETTVEKKVIDQIISAVYGHTLYMVESHWDHRTGSNGRGLVLTDASKAKIAAIYAWIVGLNHAGHTEFAEKAARDLFRWLRSMSSYGDHAEDRIGPPTYLTELHDDGSFNCFSFLRYVCDRDITPECRCKLIEKGKEGKMFTVRCMREDGYMNSMPIKYWYDYNGGLLYHGPGSRNVFAVTLEDDVLWSSHT